MKSFKLKKIVAAAVAAMTIATISPVGASAKWKQNETGWWNTEGSSYSTGWRDINNSWYYFGQDGYMHTGWANVDGTWYFMNGSGAMETGWINNNGTWYFTNASGLMQTGWVNNNGTWYFTDGSGAMKTGWVNNNGTWYFTDGSGAMQTGWVNNNGTWYFTDGSGAMQTGWVNNNGTWYFTNASGAMQTGVVEVDGKVYALATSGAMQTGEVIIDGVKYTFAASGEAVGEAPKVTNAFNSNGTPVKEDSNKPVDKDSNKEEERTHGGGGGGGSHHSKPTVQQDIDKDYKEAKIITENKIADDKYEFTFAKGLDQKGYDYVTRDLYITNDDGTATGISYENDKYTFKPGKYTVKSVIRVVKGYNEKDLELAKIYYVTPDVKTIEVK